MIENNPSLKFLISSADFKKSSEVRYNFEKIAFSKGFSIVDESPDFIVSIGGDGTMLRTIRNYIDLNVPYIGISAGTLGFLPSFKSDFESLNSLLDSLYTNDYHVLMRPLLEVESTDFQGNVYHSKAFNEVFIKNANSKMITIDINIDDLNFNTYTGDGLVISTPLGATGYAVWTGAAVLDPSMPYFQLSPITPNNSSVNNPLMHSLVIPDDKIITMNLNNKLEAPILLSCDGNGILDKKIKKVKVRVSEKRVPLVESKNYNYWKIYQSKILNKN